MYKWVDDPCVMRVHPFHVIMSSINVADGTWTLADRLFEARTDVNAHKEVIPELLREGDEILVYSPPKRRYVCDFRMQRSI